MARRKREPWKPDIIGVLVCAVVFGLIQGSPFIDNPLGFVMFCGIAGGFVGYLQIRPVQRKRLIRWIHAWFSIPATIAGAAIALILNQTGIAFITITLAAGAAVRCLRRPQDERKRLVAGLKHRIKLSVGYVWDQIERRKRR